MLLLRNLRQYPKQKRNGYRSKALQHLLLQNMTTNIDMFTQKGKKKSIDNLLQDDYIIWGCSITNELGRLSQGINNIEGNNALLFIPKSEVPWGKKVRYTNMICDYRPLKKEKYRVRLTFGGDILEYEGNASSRVSSLLEAKLLIKIVISEATEDLMS